jgi:hypothetical protein
VHCLQLINLILQLGNGLFEIEVSRLHGVKCTKIAL